MKNIFSKFVKQEDLNNSFKNEIGLLELFLLFLKTVYSTTIGKVVIILSPALVAISLSVMFPIYISVGAAQVFVTALSSGVIWGMTYFSVRRTTFYSNLNSTKISTFKVYTAIWIVMLFVTFCSETTYWITTIFLNKLNVSSLFGDILNIGKSNIEISWFKVDWFTLGYTWIGSVTLMFLACFATRWLFNTEQSFFIILLIYILVLIPFGGILPPLPNDFNYDGSININKNFNFISILSMFVPQYHLNLFNYVAIWSGSNILENGSIIGNLGNMEWISAFKWSDSWVWDFTIVYPLLIGIILLSIDILTIYLHR